MQPAFQSTLPARGATRGAQRMRRPAWNFNPRSPHGERHAEQVYYFDLFRFQSTLPARGATTFPRSRKTSTTNFNPRSPHGERPSFDAGRGAGNRFQSTLPARGATTWIDGQIEKAIISIHAPRTGSDLVMIPAFQPLIDFNPRSPHGERR